MAIAGRVAIVPKGEWSQSVTYDKLDLVTYNGNTFIAYKSSVGVEPVDGDTWMLVMQGIDPQEIENIINGTTPVGNANKLGGKGASEYALQSAVENIQITSGRTFQPHGWYRIAYRDGNTQINNNSCFISLRRTSSVSESHLIRLEATNGGARFNAISDKSEALQVMTKIRYTYDSSKTYIEVYAYHGSATYGMTANLFDITNGVSAWKKLDFEATEETVSGVTALTTYDIPANASPFTTVGGTIEKPVPAPLAINNTGNGSQYVFIPFSICGEQKGGFGFATGQPSILTANLEWKTLLHTGNKPTGTYTGNGSDSERYVYVGGGLGGIIAVVSVNGLAFITDHVTLYVTPTGVTSNNYAYLRGDQVIFYTSNSVVNASGVTYTYFRL